MRDKSGAESQTHVNWLVTKSLMTAIAPAYKASDERALVLEVMTSLGILQPHAIPSLIPELPSLIMRELQLGLGTQEGQRESTPIAPALLFLASSLHTSPVWLLEYWDETAELMAGCIRAGEVLPVLRGLDVVLDAVSD